MCYIEADREYRMEYERAIKYLKKPRLRKITYDKAKFEDFSYSSGCRDRSLNYYNQYINLKHKLKNIIHLYFLHYL